jgi:8-hydroxy-5-deazaflavin:NADPH oxidoreductase
VKIGIVGAGRIGGNLAAEWSRRGHDVVVSFKRNRDELDALARAVGARAGTVEEAVEHGDVVVLSVPWSEISAIADSLSLAGKVLIDTTNQYAAGRVVPIPGGIPTAQYNAGRFPGARYAKAFNTYTSAFQASVGDGRHPRPVAMFVGGEDDEAKRVAFALVRDAGFEPVDAGGWSTIPIMEAPRREGAVYGEEYGPEAARRIAIALRDDPNTAARLATELRELSAGA